MTNGQLKSDESLSETMRLAIRRSETPILALSRLTGVSRDSIAAFVKGEVSLRLEDADVLARLLGLRLVKVADPGTAIRTQAAAQKPASVLNRIVDQINRLQPGLELRQTGGAFFNIDLVEEGVRLQVLFRRARDRPRVEAGLAFDDSSARLNRERADRYAELLRDEILEGILQRRPTTSGFNQFIVGTFDLPADGANADFTEAVANFALKLRFRVRAIRGS